MKRGKGFVGHVGHDVIPLDWHFLLGEHKFFDWFHDFDFKKGE